MDGYDDVDVHGNGNSWCWRQCREFSHLGPIEGEATTLNNDNDATFGSSGGLMWSAGNGLASPRVYVNVTEFSLLITIIIIID